MKTKVLLLMRHVVTYDQIGERDHFGKLLKWSDHLKLNNWKIDYSQVFLGSSYTFILNLKPGNTVYVAKQGA